MRKTEERREREVRTKVHRRSATKQMRTLTSGSGRALQR